MKSNFMLLLSVLLTIRLFDKSGEVSDGLNDTDCNEKYLLKQARRK